MGQEWDRFDRTAAWTDVIEPALDLIEGPAAAECGFQPSFPRVFGAASSSFRDAPVSEASFVVDEAIWRCIARCAGRHLVWSPRVGVQCVMVPSGRAAVDSIDSGGIWTRSSGPGGRSSCPAVCVADDDKTPGAQTTHDPSARSLTHTTFLCTPFPDTHAQESARSTRARPRSFLPPRVLAPLVPRDPPLPPPSPWLAGYDTFQD